MNIALTPTQLDGLTFATNRRNQSNPDAEPITKEAFAADLLAVQCNQFASDLKKEQLASLTQVGEEVLAASPEKQAAAIAAALAEVRA